MGFWKKLFKDETQDVDYYAEGLELMHVGKYHEALTSFRLALRSAPSDVAILQQIAMAYTRIGMTDEAAKTYRTVLQRDGRSPGAHYGLAFLLLREGNQEQAVQHLEAFLKQRPESAEAERHVEHARRTLAELRAEPSVAGESDDGSAARTDPASAPGDGAERDGA